MPFAPWEHSSRSCAIAALGLFSLYLCTPILSSGAQNILEDGHALPHCVSARGAAVAPDNRTLQLEIRNTCASALTALSWAISCPGAAGDRAGSHSERLDFFPSIGLEPWMHKDGGQAIGGIAPGSSHQRTVEWPCAIPLNPGSGAAVQVKAFLLADQTSSGDREELQKIMHARRIELEELRHWAGILEAALHEPQAAGPPLRFEALEARSRMAQYRNDALGSLVAGGVQKNLFRALRAAPENRGDSGIIASVTLQRILLVYRHMIEEKSRHVFNLD